MKILVMGAYGLIGLEVAKALVDAGHTVVGLGRSASHGRTVLPQADWIGANIATLSDKDDWLHHLDGIEVVVNASGALQDTPSEKLADSQMHAISALIAAAETTGVRKFIQISAPGATRTADTAFLATKGEADDTLMRSALDWTILRPGLVLAPTAYGGTSLLRSMAAFPVFQPVVFGDRPVQTVSVQDVAAAVVRALADPAVSRGCFDLAEPGQHTLRDVIQAVRRWLALPAPLCVLDVPPAAAMALAKLADLAIWFGWRSALRTTSLKVLAGGIIADGSAWTVATGMPLRGLDESLSKLPSTLQERIFARTRLVSPLLVLILSLFWLVSGLIGLTFESDAFEVIADKLPPLLAHASVIGGSVADIAIGLGLLFRRTVKAACMASIAVSITYLGFGTLLTPELWADPLGVFVKVFPAIGLAIAAASMVEER